MIYKHFSIAHFKGISKIDIKLVQDELVLLLGLNESGKTTILKSLEAFDYRNDSSDEYKNDFFRSIRKKSNVSSNDAARITATIEIDEPLKVKDFSNIFSRGLTNHGKRDLVADFINDINEKKELKLSRVIPFKNGNPQPYYYELISDHPFSEDEFSKIFAKELILYCPFIIYFEDFKDRIPEKILTNIRNIAFNIDWYDIIDGLFYNTNKDFSIEELKKFYKEGREGDATTVLKRVNKTLNSSFSNKWKKLSGVKDIEETELTYNKAKAYFEISIIDTDGTKYNVDERSKGALWYLSFLMKTEFRRKKLRVKSGKSVFLIDEPASNLHSTAQKNMIGDFKTLVEDTSVIYSTHSQYLISLDNIKTTYIIERNKGQVKSTSWGNYIQNRRANETYYQPLANVLNIIPNSLTIPWNNSIVTEGPSDRKVMMVMMRIICPNSLNNFVIYPGTGAQDLSTLISLNLAWNANFKVMLDSDSEGKYAKNKYIEKFDLSDNTIVTLPIDNKKIEGLFIEREKEKLYELVFGNKKEGRVNKKEFSSIFSLLNTKTSLISEAKKNLSKETISIFQKLFSQLEII